MTQQDFLEEIEQEALEERETYPEDDYLFDY